jgi:hypothetical protein
MVRVGSFSSSFSYSPVSDLLSAVSLQNMCIRTVCGLSFWDDMVRKKVGLPASLLGLTPGSLQRQRRVLLALGFRQAIFPVWSAQVLKKIS